MEGDKGYDLAKKYHNTLTQIGHKKLQHQKHLNEALEIGAQKVYEIAKEADSSIKDFTDLTAEHFRTYKKEAADAVTNHIEDKLKKTWKLDSGADADDLDTDAFHNAIWNSFMGGSKDAIKNFYESNHFGELERIEDLHNSAASTQLNQRLGQAYNQSLDQTLQTRLSDIDRDHYQGFLKGMELDDYIDADRINRLSDLSSVFATKYSQEDVAPKKIAEILSNNDLEHILTAKGKGLLKKPPKKDAA